MSTPPVAWPADQAGIAVRITSVRRLLEGCAYFAAVIITGALIAIDGAIPSAFTVFFFAPIILLAYRFPPVYSVAAVAMAALFSSPAMALLGVEIEGAVLPLLWLGWPAVYLFLAVSLNQWAGIQDQRRRMTLTEQHLEEVSARNDRREQELETLSSIHTTILSQPDQLDVVDEITRRVAEVCGAKACGIAVRIDEEHQGSFTGHRQYDDMFNRMFPGGIPYGEGVTGWAMIHRRVASSSNVFVDARYDRLREYAALVGIVATAAAPLELDEGKHGALLVAYPEEREFTAEELARLERLARQTEIALRSVRQRESLSRFAFETALALTEAIESRDPYTGGHCRRLADHAALIAERLALPHGEVESIRLGAALHDMGKIVVPDSILKKPDKLTAEEYAIVKQHCYSGGQICKKVGFLMSAYPIVYHHHERWDGKGYPDGISGDRIPLGARVVAVVDAYDAMTTDRPYRSSMDFAEAEAILMDGAGTQWDPRIVDVFVNSVQDDCTHHEHLDPVVSDADPALNGATGEKAPY